MFNMSMSGWISSLSQRIYQSNNSLIWQAQEIWIIQHEYEMLMLREIIPTWMCAASWSRWGGGKAGGLSSSPVRLGSRPQDSHRRASWMHGKMMLGTSEAGKFGVRLRLFSNSLPCDVLAVSVSGPSWHSLSDLCFERSLMRRIQPFLCRSHRRCIWSWETV